MVQLEIRRPFALSLILGLSTLVAVHVPSAIAQSSPYGVITTAFTSSTHSAPAGTVVTVNGSGYVAAVGGGPGTQVQLIWDPSASAARSDPPRNASDTAGTIVLASATIDANGQFSLQFTVPTSSQPGQHWYGTRFNSKVVGGLFTVIPLACLVGVTGSCPGNSQPSSNHVAHCQESGAGYSDSLDVYVDSPHPGDYRLEASWNLSPQSVIIGAFLDLSASFNVQPPVQLRFDNNDIVSSLYDLSNSGLSPTGVNVEAFIPIAVIDTEVSAPYNGGNFRLELELAGDHGWVHTCSLSLPGDANFSASP